MIAFACAVSQFIGWRFPLATTSASTVNPNPGIWFVMITEIAWFATNVYTVILLRRNWRSPPGPTIHAVTAIVCISFPAQVFLGSLAIRDLRDFIQTMT